MVASSWVRTMPIVLEIQGDSVVQELSYSRWRGPQVVENSLSYGMKAADIMYMAVWFWEFWRLLSNGFT